MGQLQIEQIMNNYRCPAARSTQAVAVCTEETKKMKGEQAKNETGMGGLRTCLMRFLGFHGGHEAGQAGPQRLHSTIFPFGLRAEFLAHQNRRPPPSFARRFGPLVPRGCWPGSPDFL
jgi:hypothetical protein